MIENIKSILTKKIKELDWTIESEKITSLIKPCIRIKASTATNIKKGQSKFGGKPDLEENINWPIKDNRPLAFLGQINFEELENQELIPEQFKNKLIAFFICVNQEDYTGQYPEIHKTIISNTDSIDKLEKRDYPQELSTAYQFTPKKLAFLNEYSIPSYQHWTIDELALNHQDEYLYSDMVGDIFNDTFELNYKPGHQIFGYSDAIQGDTNYYWAQKKLKNKNDSRRTSTLKTEKKFEQLIQIDLMKDFLIISDGCAYFGYVKEEFDNIQKCIQCEMQNI